MYDIDPAPQWSASALVDGEFKDISLSDYKGKYVVFFWYPMDFTFVCPTEILAFSERIKEFEALDTAVIGASTDSGKFIYDMGGDFPWIIMKNALFIQNFLQNSLTLPGLTLPVSKVVLVR